MAHSDLILQLGNPRLREKAQLIHDVQDPNLQALIDQLIASAQSSNGVGIAAPQMGYSQRLFIVASRPNARYPDAPEMEPTAMINPTIVDRSPDLVKGWEGCLSVPGIRGLVPRSSWIRVAYTDRDGQAQIQDLTGFVARIFQHEYDHLEGLVFLDRVESTQDLMTEQEYQQRVVCHGSARAVE